MQRALLACLLIAPLASSAEVVSDARADFEHAMAGILEELPQVVVTSKLRTEADQQRLRAEGYTPHRHSQHKLGLAWDCLAPPELLDLVAERARAHGFVPLRMRSPVTGRAYLHVQRYPRSPLRDAQWASLPTSLADGALAPAPESAETLAVATVAETAAARENPELVAAPAVAEPLSMPRPIGTTGFEFPRRLLTRKASGMIVLRVELSAEGDVEDLRIDSSDLPAFEDFVAQEVKRWKFTPFTQQGRAVAATARLPIPIRIH